MPDMLPGSAVWQLLTPKPRIETTGHEVAIPATAAGFAGLVDWYDANQQVGAVNGTPITYQKAALNALAAGGVTTVGNNVFGQFMKGALGECGAFSRAMLGQEGLDFDRMLLRRWGIASY